MVRDSDRILEPQWITLAEKCFLSTPQDFWGALRRLLLMVLSEAMMGRGSADAATFQVICLCAEWCSTCREYKTGFEALACQFPEMPFKWIDIEARADDLGDLDIENFPTLLVLRAELVLFYGVMLPYPAHLRRTIENFLEQTLQQSRDYAFANPERRAWQTNADFHHLAGLGDSGIR